MTDRIRYGFTAEDLPSRWNWRTSELAIIDRYYPTGGVTACLPHLPGRSKDAIRMRAHLRGVRLLRREVAA